MDKLEACPKCQSPCVVETFSGQSIDGVVTLFMCSNDHPHGGWCDQPAYFAANDWNTAAMPAPDERAAIVAWLREQSKEYDKAMTEVVDHHQKHRDLAGVAVTMELAADAMERGDHLKE